MTATTTVYLVDASLYVFRAWHSMPADQFRDADGWPTNAVHGFARFLLELLERERPRHIANRRRTNCGASSRIARRCAWRSAWWCWRTPSTKPTT